MPLLSLEHCERRRAGRREERDLKTEVIKGEGHQVTLKVEAGPDDMKTIVDQTYRELGGKVKIPGFRKGKVPRKVIDSHLGAEFVYAEAVKKGLPTLYVMGVFEAGILPVSDPDISLLEADEEGGRVVFEAKVDVKPEIEVHDYKGLELVAPETELKDEEVDEALEEARDRFATLEVVESRPAEKGDFVHFDYKVFADGVPLEGKSGTDRMTEIGSNDFLEGFDTQLIGGRKGDILDVVITFPPDYGEPVLAGKPATFRTIVKEIKRKVLPPLDDDLAKEISSHETLEEFKDDLRGRLASLKEMMAGRQLKDEAVRVIVEQTPVDLPDSMVEHQVEREIEAMSEELAERGVTLEDYLNALKGTRSELEKAIREKVADGIKAELILDAVATAEGIEVSDGEAEDYIRENALAAGGDPDKVIADARKHDRIMGVKANLRLAKAVDFLVENAVLTGPFAQSAEAEAEAGGESGLSSSTVEPPGAAVDGEAQTVPESAEPGGEAPPAADEGSIRGEASAQVDAEEKQEPAESPANEVTGAPGAGEERG